MQRLAFSHGGRRIQYNNPSAIRLFSVPSNAEPPLNVSEPPFVPVKSHEDPPASQDKTPSSSRMAPRVSSLGDISIPRVMNRTPPIQIKNDQAPTENPQSSVNYLSNSTLDFSSRLAKRQWDKASSIQPSGENPNKMPLEMSASLQRRLEGRKRAKERGVAEMFATGSRTPANTRSHDANAQNQTDNDQRQGLSGQRPRGGVNTHHVSRPRDTKQGSSTSNPHHRARGRTGDSHRNSTQDQHATESSPSTPKRPPPSKKDGGNKHIFTSSPGFSEKPNISETNLHTLFSEVTTHQNTPSITSQRPSGETLAFLRTQVMLEEAGGDYSRYLPPKLVGMGGIVGPVRYAHLTLARRKDVGLRSRRNAVKIINASAGGNRAA